MPFHVMPFEKRFLKNDFLLKYHQKPHVLKRRSIRKREKRKKRKKLRVSLNKRGSLYSERRKTL
jgi:hypothetical protein